MDYYCYDPLVHARICHGLPVRSTPQARRFSLTNLCGFAAVSGFRCSARRLARDYERLAATLVGLHFLAFACLMLQQFTLSTLSP